MQEFRRNLTIAEKALIGIITSSIEIYKKELYGFLLGEKHRKHYMIYDAINFLSARRSYQFVNIPSVRINRVSYVLFHLTNLRLIGDFHSHPEGPDRLSGLDKADIKKSSLTLSVLIVVNKTKRKVHGWEIKDKNIVGFIGNKYHIKIMAFEYDKKQDKLFHIKIVCPCLKKLNKLKNI